MGKDAAQMGEPRRAAGSGAGAGSVKPARSASWDAVRLLAAGAMSGAVTKTAIAPLERVKILQQLEVGGGGPGSPTARSAAG